MANLGLPGPSNALVPFSSVEEAATGGIGSASHGSLKGVFDELGLTSSRQDRRDESDLEFDRIQWSAQDGELMTEETFVGAAAQHWGFSRLAARAMFFASDIDSTARINKNEYVLLREAFVNQDPASASNALIQEIQLRAGFFKQVLSRPAQRTAIGVRLTNKEAADFVHDLCSGKTHVQTVADKLLPRIWADQDSISLDEFVGAFLKEGKVNDLLEAQTLAVRDIVDTVKGHSHGPRRGVRVVLDGRAESAFLPTPLRPKQGIDSDIVGSEAVNADMTLDPEVRAVGGWRGPIAVARQSPEYEAAMEVVAAAMDLAQQESTREDVLDRYWLLNGAALEKLLGKGESQQADKICLLAKACSRQCSSYPSLVRVRAPAKVFGDIHGQLRDLLLLFGLFGKPYHCGGDIQTMSYVFNGDWVDRGEHQLEVVTLLFALHVLYPQQVYLVRGNHEFRDMSENMGELGFLHHCQQRMRKRWRLVFEAIHSAFDWLPIGALVGDKALVIHGGLGDGSWGLHDLEHVKRPMQTLMDDNALNALWSDPSDSDHCMARGVHANEERGEGAGIHQFGPDVTQAFCRREGINLVIRSHQFVRQGFKVMHGGHLITLFSARNYLWEDGEASENDAAILLLATDLNGHLRVHPKRIAFMPNPGPPKPSWWEKTMSDISACWHFMATGQRLNKKRRVSVRGSGGAANVKFVRQG